MSYAPWHSNWSNEVGTDDVLWHLAEGIHSWIKQQGFYDQPFNFGEKIALIHSELSEALEADRKNLQSDHCPELTGVEEELADTFVRLLDLCAHLKIDLGRAVAIKMDFNLTRPRLHGKAY